MQRTAFTTAVIRSRDGRAEVISRPGHVDPHDFARAAEGSSDGQIVAVRHERVTPDGLNRVTVALFPMESH